MTRDVLALGDDGASHGESPEFGAWPGIAEPEVSFAVRDWPTRLGLVSAGLGIALVPRFAAPALPHGVRWIPVRGQGDGLRRQICAVTTQDASPAARAMVRALEDEVTGSF